MAILNADSGKVIAMPDIGDGCDATGVRCGSEACFRVSRGRDHYSNSRRYAGQVQRRGNNQDSRSREDDGAGSENSRTLYVTAKVLPERKVEPDTFVVLVVGKSK